MLPEGPQTGPVQTPRSATRNAIIKPEKWAPARPSNEPPPENAHQWSQKKGPKIPLEWTHRDIPKQTSEMAPKWASDRAPNCVSSKLQFPLIIQIWVPGDFSKFLFLMNLSDKFLGGILLTLNTKMKFYDRMNNSMK